MQRKVRQKFTGLKHLMKKGWTTRQYCICISFYLDRNKRKKVKILRPATV